MRRRVRNEARMKTGIWTRAFLVSTGLAAGVSAAEWNQWRGPQRDGIASGFKAPAAWSPAALAKQWTVTVGEGHASPVIDGDRVFIFARDGEEEVMRCLALADGKELWKQSHPVPYEMNPAARGHGKGPKATPTLADGRIFTLGINGHVSAYDAKTGAVLWRKDFAKDYKDTAPAFGASASPLVDGDKVIVHVGGEGGGALTAFDVATGAVKWKWDGDGPAYASPIIGTFGGVRQVITQSQKHCFAVSPADGKLLWKIPFATPYDQNSVTPVVVGDLVIFAGLQKPTFAVKVNGTTAEQVWESPEMTMYMSSPVVNGSTVFGMSNKQRGSLFAMNAKTGEVLWKSEGRIGENASLTDIGSALLVMSTSGDLTVQQKAGSELKEVAKYKVASTPVWASPAVTGDKVLIKDKTTLVLFAVGGS